MPFPRSSYVDRGIISKFALKECNSFYILPLKSAKCYYLCRKSKLRNMEHLVRIYKKLLRETDTGFFRYLYKDIAWGNRMIGIRGPQGVGKTTY